MNEYKENTKEPPALDDAHQRDIQEIRQACREIQETLQRLLDGQETLHRRMAELGIYPVEPRYKG